VSFYPWIVPFEITLWEAAANPKSLSLMLIGVAIVLPCILAYTLLSYYVFKGKVRDEEGFGAY
jgi:cytochrome d ubiquinol oxidase subunit II